MLNKDELDGLKARVYSMQQFISISAKTYIEDMTRLLRHIDLMRVEHAYLKQTNHITVTVPHGAGEIAFTVKAYQDEDGKWVAECPMLKGCNTQGDTLAEALDNIKDAVIGYLDALKVGDGDAK